MKTVPEENNFEVFYALCLLCNWRGSKGEYRQDYTDRFEMRRAAEKTLQEKHNQQNQFNCTITIRLA